LNGGEGIDLGTLGMNLATGAVLLKKLAIHTPTARVAALNYSVFMTTITTYYQKRNPYIPASLYNKLNMS
jgi:hypothetical protein